MPDQHGEGNLPVRIFAAAPCHGRRRIPARGGWRRVGDIPNYALMPDGAPCPTTVFYKALY